MECNVRIRLSRALSVLCAVAALTAACVLALPQRDAHAASVEGYYAFLYGNGTLVVQADSAPDASQGEVVRSYDPAQTAGATLSDVVGEDKNSVTKIVFETPVVLEGDASAFFKRFRSVESIEGIELVDTSRVTSMDYMFDQCVFLESLDLSSWDTSHVTSMQSMFSQCGSLLSLDVSSWDTGRVCDMSFLFQECSSLLSLDVAAWDTSQVVKMNRVFSKCSSLTALDVSGWDVADVTDMSFMFLDCVKLKSLDLTCWSAPLLKSVNHMFSGCSSLVSIDLPFLKTNLITDMNSLFYGCSSLSSVDVSAWDTSRVVDMGCMFYRCSSLASLDFSGWNTSSTSSMMRMFYGCSSLTALDLSSWDTSKVVASQGFGFLGKCSNLGKLILGDRFVNPGNGFMSNLATELPGADGAWHCAAGAFQPDDVPSGKGTYSAVPLPAEAEITRIAGDYANQTSAMISAQAFPEGSEWVVIARDDDFADAMSATGLAGALECPIVLTGRTSLSKAAADEVRRLGAKRAYVIGGKGAIPADLERQLARIGCRVEARVFGEYAYDTSVECARLIARHGGGSDAIVAMGTNFQDALSISSFAYAYKLPIFLTMPWEGRALPASAVRAVKAMDGTIWVPGGPGAVPESAVEKVFRGRDIVRLYGYDGYGTSNAIAHHMAESGLLSAESCVVACGAQGPKGADALSGAALAGRAKAPILLVNGNPKLGRADLTVVDAGIPGGQAAFMKARSRDISQVWVLGGAYVMPQKTVDRMAAVLKRK